MKTHKYPLHVVLFHAVLLGPLAVWPQASGVVIRLIDVAEQAGITLLNICGGPSKDYIVEVNGNGAAFFDYDNDSDMDVLIVNGSTLANIKHGGDQMVALFRNDGRGRFADVTPASRLRARGWGMGTCIADYDNDGFVPPWHTASSTPRTLCPESGQSVRILAGCERYFATFSRSRMSRTSSCACRTFAACCVTSVCADVGSVSFSALS